MSFEIISGEKTQPIIHAEGKILYGAPLAKIPDLDLAAIRSRCSEQKTREAIYSHYQSIGLDYGPSFQVIETVLGNEHEALAEIRLPSHLTNDDDSLYLHPSLMDGALQAITGIVEQKETSSSLYLPFSVGEISIYDPLPSTCQVYVNRTEADAVSRYREIPNPNGRC